MSTIDKLTLIHHPSTVNVVRKTAAVSPAVSDYNRQAIAENGKSPPPAGVNRNTGEVKKVELSKAARDVSGYIQNITRELNFSVDEDLDRTVITVIDEETGEVVRRIPSEEFLSMAKNISEIQESETGKGVLFQGDA